MATQKEVKIVISAQDRASASLKKLQSNLKTTQKTTGDLRSGFGSLAIIAKTVAKGALVASAAFGAFAIKSAFSAGRAEELRLALNAIAKANGLVQEEVDETVNALRKNNIANSRALQITSRFIQAELDLADATKLSTVAKDLAVIAGLDSSEATETLTDAIVSNQSILLKQFGIVTTVDKVLEEYGETVGKSSEELTELERKQAFLNIILEAGEKVAGTYEAAMGSVSKRYRSLTGRIIPDFLEIVGKAFTPALIIAVDAVSNALKGLTKWIKDAAGEGKDITAVLGKLFRDIDAKTGIITFLKKQFEIISKEVKRNLIPTIIRNKDIFIDMAKAIGLILVVAIISLVVAIRASIAIMRAAIDITGWWREQYRLAGERIKWFADIIASTFNNIWSIITSKLEAAGNVVKEWVAARIDDFKELFQTLVGGSIVPDMVNGIIDEMDRMKDSLGEIGDDDILQGVKESMEETKDIAQDTTDSIVEGMNDFKNSFGDAVNKIKELQGDIRDENKNFKESQRETKNSYLEDLFDIVTREREKLAEKKEQLAEEIAENEGASQKKIGTLQGEIQKIEEFLHKHRKEIKKINNFKKKDAIEKLKETFVEEKKANKQRHKEQIQNLKGRIKEVGATFKEGFDRIYEQLKDHKLTGLIKQIQTMNLPTGKTKKGKGKAAGFQMGTQFVPQTGLAMLHKGEKVIPAGQASGMGFGGTVNINMGGVTVNNEADENRLVDKIRSALNRDLDLSQKGLI